MRKNFKWQLAAVIAAVAVILLIGVPAVSNMMTPEPEPEIDVLSTLEKIVEVSDLSTAKFTYQGYVAVPDQDNLKKTAYYVCYNAQVYAGIDFSKITFEKDDEEKTVTVKIPEVEITDIIVDTASFDYMFVSKKANDISNLAPVVLTACEEDIKQECTSESALLDSAKQNAVNAVKALTEPIVEQALDGYTLKFEEGGAEV